MTLFAFLSSRSYEALPLAHILWMGLTWLITVLLTHMTHELSAASKRGTLLFYILIPWLSSTLFAIVLQLQETYGNCIASKETKLMANFHFNARWILTLCAPFLKRLFSAMDQNHFCALTNFDCKCTKAERMEDLKITVVYEASLWFLEMWFMI